MFKINYLSDGWIAVYFKGLLVLQLENQGQTKQRILDLASEALENFGYSEAA